MKTCICGISFAPKSGNQKYHSRQCCDRHKAQKYRLQRKLSGKCPQCGGEMDYHLTKYEYKDINRPKLSYCSKCREYFKQHYEKKKA